MRYFNHRVGDLLSCFVSWKYMVIKMTNVFDITEFGAVGDGKTDSTDAIQQALNKAAECCGKVVVPPGTYSVKGNLKMHGHAVSLVGASAWSFSRDGASTFVLNSDTADCMIDISGADGCLIKGMSLNGKRLGKNIHGVKLYWPVSNGGGREDTPTVDDCRIGSFTGDGLHFEHIWCFSVRHSMIYYNGGAGLMLSGWDAFIIDNWFTNNDTCGIDTCGYVASITATGNRVEWNKKAGFRFPSGDSFNITGNFFDRTFGPAMVLGSDDGEFNLATVTGNVLRRNGAYTETPHSKAEDSSHIIMNHCTGCTFVGNTMKVGEGDGGVPPVSPDYGIIIRNSKNTIVKDNTLHNGSLKNNLTQENNENCLIENNIGSPFVKG